MNELAPESSSIPSQRPRRWKAVVILTLVFFLGIAFGVGGSLLLVRRSIKQQMTQTTVPDMAPVDAFMDRLSKRISSELQLGADESAAVQAELKQTALQVKKVRVQSVIETRRIAADTLRRVQQHVPEDRRAELRRRVIARLAPWGILNEADEVEQK